MKHQIDTLIAQIRNLQSLESVLSIVQHMIQESKQEDEIRKINQIILLIQKINNDLPRSISSFLSSQEPLHLTSVENDLLEVLTNVEIMSSNSIPNKSELLELLASLKNTLSKDNIVTVLSFIKDNRSEYQNQLFTIEEICAHH